MVADNIKNQITRGLKILKLPSVKVQSEHPVDERHGDYATNVAFVLAKEVDRDSQKLAEKIAKELKKNLPKFIAKVEVARPGFINFWLSEHFLLSELKRVSNLGDGYGQNKSGKGKKIMVEFTDPNPFKEFHIGHLYSNIVGESLARLFEVSGAVVKRANYQGDVGIHVAKSLWGMRKLSTKMPDDEVPLDKKAAFMGKSYSLGATAYEEEEKARKEIEELNKKIYDQNPEIVKLYEKGRQWSLDYFEIIYARLGTKFDFCYFEREAGKLGLDVVKKGLKQGVFHESQGAVVFPGEKYGLHTRVFINSEGLPTYEAKDLGLAPTKYKDFAYDQSIIVTANEVDEYFRVVLKALNILNPDLGKKARHISHGMVRLPEGKMSSRTGKILTGEWLLNEARKRVIEIFKRQGSELSDQEQKEVSEMVGMAAVRYALLKSHIGRNIAFDFTESVSFEGDSGPYLQYTHARAKSVLSKAKRLTFKGVSFKGVKLNPEELDILRWLYRYPEVVMQAGEEYAPNLICHFLYELAQRYNTFYNKHRILNAKSKEQQKLRLALTATVAQVIKNGLYILGVGAPAKM